MPEPDSQILIYQPEGGRTRIDVRLEAETVWLTQAQMAELFQTTPQNITLHIKTIYEEAEAEEQATCKHYLQVQQEGERKVRRSLKHYNLEVIIAVGYRVRSHRGTQFRRWATERLRDYLVKGFAMDDERLKEGRNLGADYFDELLERIRDIRTSPKACRRNSGMVCMTTEDRSHEPFLIKKRLAANEKGRFMTSRTRMKRGRPIAAVMDRNLT